MTFIYSHEEPPSYLLWVQVSVEALTTHVARSIHVSVSLLASGLLEGRHYASLVFLAPVPNTKQLFS
jgi:hypothetical protein